MKKNLLWVLAAVALFCMSLSSCTDNNDNPSGPTPVEPKSEYSIFVMSDIHVMAPQLLVQKGKAFEDYTKVDPKLLEESGEVLDNVIDVVLEKKPDLVLIPGDLTKDGELVSHQMVVSLLERIRTAGIPTVVIPGNHDIDNPEGVYYQGDQTRPAERTSTQQFAQLYANYGYKRSASNLTYGLVWHVNDSWATIQTYRNMFSLLGVSNFIPDTPQKTTELLMEFLSTPFTEAFMIHNTGNENENPRSLAVIDEFEDGVKKLCLKQLKGQVPDDQLDASATAVQGMLMQYIKPTLTSMLTDTNQASDAPLSSRTNDLNAVLTIPKPTQ